MRATHGIRAGYRFGVLDGVVRGAASVDADVAAMVKRIQSEFYENQRAVVESLARKKALKRGLGVERATDILWTLNHPDAARLAPPGLRPRLDSGEQYEEWFADAACQQLAGTPVLSLLYARRYSTARPRRPSGSSTCIARKQYVVCWASRRSSPPPRRARRCRSARAAAATTRPRRPASSARTALLDSPERPPGYDPAVPAERAPGLVAPDTRPRA